MRRYGVATSLFLSAVLSLASGPRAWAEPEDLPKNNQVQFPKCADNDWHGDVTIGIDILSGRITIDVNNGKATDATTIDAVTPALMPGCIGLIVERLNAWLGAPAQATSAGMCPCEKAGDTKSPVTVKDMQAADLFKIAESCRQHGEFQKARTCYQQVHMLTPTTRVGRMAIDRLIEIEERMRDSHEEAEPPAPRPDSPQSSRAIPEHLIPLGVVELSY